MDFSKINVKKVKFTKVAGSGFVKWTKKGQEVIGYLVGSEIRKGKFGKQKNFTLQNGEEKFLIGGAVICNQLEGIKKGTIIKIVFLGEVKKGKNTYKNFEISKGE